VRINKVTSKFWVISVVLVLVAASLTGLIFRASDPFKAPAKVVAAKSISDFYEQELDWRNCYGKFECTKFQVPIDYENLELGTFDIAVLKRATSSAIGN